MKTCNRCKKLQPKDNFYKNKKPKDGLTYGCKDCLRAISRLTRQKRRDRVGEAEWLRIQKHNDLNAKYGISIDEYNAMATKQNNRCAICLKEPKVLYVDHCHKTGVIRGLLCNKCNLGLGRFDDDAELVQRAFKYLSK